MPLVPRVIENEVKGDGTIESVVKTTGTFEWVAKRKAISRALRHNGYADVVFGGSESGFKVDKVETVESRPGPRKTFVIEVVITTPPLQD